MNSPQPPNDRQRLQELLAIPERDRTDAQWDEIHELEISLAPGNRERGPDPNLRRAGQGPMQSGARPPNQGNHPRPNGGGGGNGGNAGGNGNANGGGGNGGQGKKPGRRFHRPKRPPQ